MTQLAGVSRIDLNPLGGLAGDMFAAALLDAFPEQMDSVVGNLRAAGAPDGVTARLEPADASGFRGARFLVAQETEAKPPRTLAEVETFLSGGTLDDRVRRHALAIFRVLAEAEAAVHGETIERVHFHEVSDWDSLVDILTAASLIARLDAAQWRCGPLPLGRGTVKTAHGALPVPAPATLEILRGFEWIDDGAPGERVTPTGAAILRHLDPSPLGGPARGRLAHIGVGCGTRRIEGRPNILRALVFSEVSEAAGEDVVERLSFEVDDMTGEEIAVALDRLRALSGVIDVTTSALSGKKGRPATGFRLLVVPEAAESTIEACFLETSTLGVRFGTVRRRKLERRGAEAQGLRIKTATRPGGVVTVKAESDDLAATPGLAARRGLAIKAAARVEETDDE